MKRLFAVSGNRCAFPRCTIEIFNDGAIVGEMCHIKAANPNGPRYDAQQSPEERHSFDNLILLCAIHHKVIDDDEEAYTVERLTNMKRDLENSATPLPDSAVNAAVTMIQSIGQSGGITAHTFKADNIHFHASAQPADDIPSPSRAAAAREILSPELARVLAQQIHILDRAMVNFVCASTQQALPGDHWSVFRPLKPSLYPSATEIRDLPKEDAPLLAEFYDCLLEIDDLVTRWRETDTVWDGNVWNHLMQSIGHSVKKGVQAVERFCPTRQYSPIMPAAGTLIERAAISTRNMHQSLDAHLKRAQARESSRSTPPRTSPRRR